MAKLFSSTSTEERRRNLNMMTFSELEIEAARQLIQLCMDLDLDLQKKTSNCKLQERRHESDADDDLSSCTVVDEGLMSTMVDDDHECSMKSRKKRRFRSIDSIYSLTNPLPVAGSSAKKKKCE
ncbi:uncharacterized protein LOC107178828 [Citrus sinensis]|uniref:uncharacterized protein LOC107178828 n=1 Tax=Citrus sinensis TaxID=2711 RepID=UPI0022779EA8|nr:uncharacterized protein LOC107178828 [Citrus sinensis]